MRGQPVNPGSIPDVLERQVMPWGRPWRVSGHNELSIPAVIARRRGLWPRLSVEREQP